MFAAPKIHRKRRLLTVGTLALVVGGMLFVGQATAAVNASSNCIDQRSSSQTTTFENDQRCTSGGGSKKGVIVSWTKSRMGSMKDSTSDKTATKTKNAKNKNDSKTSNVKVPAELERIAQCESGGEPNPYKAINHQGSSASGKYQMIDETWRRTAKKVGVDTSKYKTARDAPPAVQDKVATHLYETEGSKPWACAGK